ncbi:MAG TPA: hypothetical protein VFI05_07550 [Nitrospiraceae bacterium]|nr:hypothetical protein [Nitrospiraceae bacterium]
MHKPDTQATAPQSHSTKLECCTDLQCETGLKNNYFEGKRLTPETFRVEQRYLVERRWLLNRAIHGWGMVYGYGVNHVTEHGLSKLEVQPGLALDQCGRELLQVKTRKVGLDDVIVIDGNGARTTLDKALSGTKLCRHKNPDDSQPVCGLLSVHYAEQYSGPVMVTDPCRCAHHEWDQTCETVRYSLQRIDCDKCCNPFPCELTCECGTGRCCDEHKDPVRIEDPRSQHEKNESYGQRNPCKPFTRGGCRCLCDHLTGLHPGDERCSLCEVEEPCGHVRVDLRHGVPLACVGLVEDDCGRWTLDQNEEVEACGPRRLVKRNDLLFDLIRGCDLTRISAIGWAKWHRSNSLVRWTDFAASFGTEHPPGSGRNVTADYWVEFSRPVRSDTVRADCFSMTILVAEDEAGWLEVRRVPILGVETSAEAGVPAGHVTRATVVVDAEWVRDATVSKRTIFNQDEAQVEIEVFGDYMVDCNGQTVDANIRGLCAVPSGNGTPGGTLRSNFRVEVRDPHVRPPSYDTSPRQGA